MRKINLFFSLISAIMFLSCKSTTSTKDDNTSYGVFLGISSDDLKDSRTGHELEERILSYDTIVIDAQEVSEDYIRSWKNSGHKVFSYINTGALEDYRDYYEDYKDLCLEVYTNWEDECWVDVTAPKWQTFMQELASRLAASGIDGFFVDNADVYYHHKEDSFFEALCTITSGFRKILPEVIINGGDTFVSRLIKEGKTSCISGVNQECVFSTIKDYKKDIFAAQDAEETEYFTQYLADCKAAKLSVYLLEYTKDQKLVDSIVSYCKQEGFKYYVSSKVDLR